MEQELNLPLSDHLNELRRRVFICLAVIFGLFFVLFIGFKEQVLVLFSMPMHRAFAVAGVEEGLRTLHVKEPTEVFFSYMKLSFLGALCIGIPVVLHQIWRFVSPGLYGHERRATLPFVLSSTLAFFFGVSFCFFLVLPYGYGFLLSYALDSGVQPTMMVGEYVAVTTRLLLAFGVVFQVPVVITFLSRIGLVTGEQLGRYRAHALVLSFVAAAVLTPPDVITQLLLGLPLYMLFELSIVGSRILGKGRAAKPQRVGGQSGADDDGPDDDAPDDDDEYDDFWEKPHTTTGLAKK